MKFDHLLLWEAGQQGAEEAAVHRQQSQLGIQSLHLLLLLLLLEQVLLHLQVEERTVLDPGKQMGSKI